MRTAELVAEREALEELIRSDGWRIFLRYIVREWEGAGYRARMGSAIQTNDAINVAVVHRLSDQILALVRWPEERVRELGGAAE